MWRGISSSRRTDRRGRAAGCAGGVPVWLTGLQLRHPHAAATACRPASSTVCRNLVSDFTSTYDRRATVIPAVLQAVLALEPETGTFRYASDPGLRGGGRIPDRGRARA